LQRLNIEENNAQIITGLPPIYKDKMSILNKQVAEVLPQGLGIFFDVFDKKIGEELLIIDIGFNTVDYVVVVGDIKKKGNTLEKQGVERMIELFRNKLPAELSYLKQFQFQRLLEVFERGYALVESEKVDLNGIKNKAIEEYNELLKTRLKDEIGNLLEEVEQVVIAGGGAYYLKNLRKAGVYVPENPEFSQARGYVKCKI
jgi:hypothetical protein